MGEHHAKHPRPPLIGTRPLAARGGESAGKATDAPVTCKDGSTSKAGRGACSHHGGPADAQAQQPGKSAKNDAKVDNGEGGKTAPARSADKGGILGTLFGNRGGAAQGRGSTPSPRSSTKENRSGTPTARCKDGTASYSAHHSGTCSGHGGVAEWLDR